MTFAKAFAIRKRQYLTQLLSLPLSLIERTILLQPFLADRWN